MVVVSCVSKDKPFKAHPNSLIGPDCNKDVCTVRVHKSNKFVCPRFTIHKAEKQDIETQLKQRKYVNVDPYLSKYMYINLQN